MSKNKCQCLACRIKREVQAEGVGPVIGILELLRAYKKCYTEEEVREEFADAGVHIPDILVEKNGTMH